MTRKINTRERRIQGLPPIGAVEADKLIRQKNKEANKKYEEELVLKYEEKPEPTEYEDVLRKYSAKRLVFDPSRTLLSKELVQDFTDWAEANGYQVNKNRVVQNLLASSLFSMWEMNVQRVQVALVTDVLLAKLDTDTPPTTKKVAVWHGVRWRTEEEDLL